MNHSSSQHTTKRPTNLRLRIVVLIAVVIALVICWFTYGPKPNRNALAIAENAVLPETRIDIQPPAELNFKSKPEILELRIQAVNLYPGLI